MTSDFAQLGLTFNDATRALEGGLWQNTVAQAGQGNGSVFRYVNDLTAVQSGLEKMIQSGQFTGSTLADVNKIVTDLHIALLAAPASVNGGGGFGSVTVAEEALRASHLDILNIVNHNPQLQALATQDDSNGFMAVPPTLHHADPYHAPHATLAEIGAIFNDAANRILGGVNSSNKEIIIDDMNAISKDLEHLIHSEPNVFNDITGIHADTVARQAQLEIQFVNQACHNVDAGRASNDNMLDMIDIIQGDPVLQNLANQEGIHGFAAFPDALNPTPRFQDNAAQTNFWATFISQGNSLGQKAEQLVGSGNTKAIHQLIEQFEAFEQNTTKFDKAQGGIFEARFDNELTPNSTLGAEVDAMIRGLKTGDAALVKAAAQVIHDNAADVAGNNIPVLGGHYNPDGLTAAEVLSTGGVTPLASTDTHHQFVHMWG
jgi:hypothetical protein